MIGDTYWSTGITVRYGYAAQGRQGWAARLTYLDAGFCNDDPANGVISTEGALHTRYMVAEAEGADVLTAVIDALKADAERLGIDFHGSGSTPCLYYEGDGEDPDYPPPYGWQRMLAEQSARLGWKPLYAAEPDDVACGLADET